MKADWHFGSIDNPPSSGVDPFESASSGPIVIGERPSWSAPVSIDTDSAELQNRLCVSLRREARLFDGGITCEFKEMPDFSCLACPFSEADDEESKKCALCRIGSDQEVISTLLLAKQRQPVGV